MSIQLQSNVIQGYLAAKRILLDHDGILSVFAHQRGNSVVELLSEERHEWVHQLESSHQHQLEGGEGGGKVLRVRVCEMGLGGLQVDVAEVGVQETAEAAGHGGKIPLAQMLLHLRNGDGAAGEDPAILRKKFSNVCGLQRQRGERFGPLVRHDEEPTRLPDLVPESAGRLDDGQIEVNLSAADIVHAEAVTERVRAAFWDAGGEIFSQAV